MRILGLVAALAALVVGAYVSRIVVHGFTDHGQLDLFHLVVAAVLAVAGLLLLYRTFRGSPRAG